MPPNTLDRMRGFRLQVGRRLRRPDGRHQPAQFRLQPGHRGPGQHRERQRLASRANGRVDFTKIELTVSRLQPLLRRASRSWSPPTGNRPAPRCWSPSSAAMAGACSAAPSTPRNWSGTPASRLLAELRYDIPHDSKRLPRLSSMASPTMAGSIILPRFRAHLAMWMLPRWELDFAWDG